MGHSSSTRPHPELLPGRVTDFPEIIHEETSVHLILPAAGLQISLSYEVLSLSAECHRASDRMCVCVFSITPYSSLDWL